MIYFKSIIFLIVLGGGLVCCEFKKDLISCMDSLQNFSHKLSLSIDFKNQELSNFYLHEIEEVIEDLNEIEHYHEIPIQKLTKAILEPSFKELEKVVKENDWKQASKKMDKMIQSCNQCHRSVGFDYIQIVRTTQNPFMQSFTP